MEGVGLWISLSEPGIATTISEEPLSPPPLSAHVNANFCAREGEKEQHGKNNRNKDLSETEHRPFCSQVFVPPSNTRILPVRRMPECDLRAAVMASTQGIPIRSSSWFSISAGLLPILVILLG
ncbi:hypothetical protein KQX54_020950 [Cotesia glomerata]|uniref:Uncharacterized protein n=1 Tax=Cotesia glomerata TaxID=32391 RepID=A0AAV7I558_COTGL|nr:hypothetical protein KQX54_020950 [Cotesia glomerata]